VLLLVAGSLLLGLALVLVIDAARRPAEARREAFRRVVAYAEVRDAPRQAHAERPRLAESVVPLLSRVALRLTPRVHRDELQLRLEAAGLAERLDPQRFLALKTVVAALGFVMPLAVLGPTAWAFLLAFAAAGAGLFGPDLLLVRAARSRASRLTFHLPQVIDQIAISLEAGLAFDAAVSYFVRKGRSPLVDELRLMLSEVRMGESRNAALRRLADRVPSDEMRSFVQTLIQSEGVGISRAALLRNQANDLRLRRQLAAEERAHRVPVKILFPTLVFIFPVMLIVILGPALQQVSKLLHHH
jgi:tight adherence protein C